MEYLFRMENQPKSPTPSEFSGEWIDLSARVRHLAEDLKCKTAGTHLAAESSALVEDATKLCAHVERLHQEAAALVAEAEARELERAKADHPPAAEEIQLEAVKIHRELHEMRPDFKDIIKALFMWQDDPAERLNQEIQTKSSD
jgi:hypothetical protein